jgi:spermidine synthase
MRVLLYASWHHFAFLVISIALLGFGASGTALCFLRGWLLRRGSGALFGLVLATAVAIPLSLYLAQHIPIEARFVPALLTRQLLRWLVYWTVLALPFLLGATGLGLALILAGQRVPTVYAANLVGSAVGVVFATALMYLVPPAWLAAWMGAVVLTGVFGGVRYRARLFWLLAAVVGTGTWLAIDPPRIRIDPFKYLAYVQRLQRDGNATPVARAYSPRAVVELFSGPAFHDLPFLSVGESPPPITSIVLDGQAGGSLLGATSKEEARVVEHTLMSLPYQFVHEKPRVLLLGETGGANVWLAARHDASAIDVVQPNRELITLIKSTARDGGGRVFELPGVAIHYNTPRHFVEQTAASFDLIQLVSMESWAVETGGIAGLSQNYLVTVEGVATCLARLPPNGILAVGRGIQLPPRDNAKILNTIVKSLKRIGIERPEAHVVMLRDYLGVCTMVKRSQWTPDEIGRLRAVASARELTPVYFAGIREDELNQPDHLPGPEGGVGDWLHHATTRLLSPDANAFIDRWAFDIRTPTDNRPFFGNFTKLRAIGELKRAFGDLWLTRTELALLFVLAATAIIAIVGLVLTIVPLLWVRGIRRSSGLGVTGLYFTAIGLAYLMLEITLLSSLIHLIGDPMLAGAAAIAGFLFFSGLGSLVAQKLSRPTLLPRLILVLVLVGIDEAWIVGWATSIAGPMPALARAVLAVIIIGPLGFLMGFPMPSALRRLETSAPQLIPWAWGVNGFASVLAPPLATAIGMTVGFWTAGAAALGCYLAAAAVFRFLPAANTGDV